MSSTSSRPAGGPDLAEETVNWMTHGLGVLLILAGFPFLLLRYLEASPLAMTIGIAGFGIGLFTTYLASTVYHLAKDPRWKYRLQILDHMAIFLLIGGTYAPVVIHYTSPATATWFLSLMGSLIVGGIILKCFFTGKYERLSSAFYLALGWMLVLIYQPIYENMPLEVFVWIAAGGFFYTTGVIFFNWNALRYNHAIWHLFVLGGSICHFVAIWKII